MTRPARPVPWLLACALIACSGCRLLGYSFSGGGLPPDIRTVAVLPFENETSAAELPLELSEALREGLEKRLGLRGATEERADAIVRGRIVRYDVDVPIGVSSDRERATAARRRLTIGLNIELVNQRTGQVLWQKQGLVADGEYAERGEENGRRQAIERIVTEVIEGAQSQW